MAERLEPEQVVERLAKTPQPRLIAIDGLPGAGKSTLAEALQAKHGFDCLTLDEFVRPKANWRAGIRPAFPFEYIRYDEFVTAILGLGASGRCTYRPFDWQTLSIATEPRTITLSRPVVIEGVSSLNSALCPAYGLRIFVDSDPSTMVAALQQRGFGSWAEEWGTLFLPSVDIYMQTRPELRADLLVRGRGL